MANHRRFAWLCLLLLSLTNCVVLGKVRGANNAIADNGPTLEDSTTDSDTSALRKLKHHNGMRRMHHNGMNKAAKGGKESDDAVEVEEEHHHTIDPDSEYPHPHPEQPKGGSNGGKEAGGKEAGAKVAGAKNVGGKQKSGKYKGSKEKSTSKSDKYKSSKKSYKSDKSDKGYKSDKGGKKTDKSYKYKEKGGKKSGYDKSDKSKSKKGYKYHAVEKKAKSSYKDKDYVKSKEKLTKYSDDYYYESDAPAETEIPGGVQDPTLVEVPMTFSFAFVNPEERRRLDGHTAYEPTPEEIQTLDHAIKEYSVGLFEYLHEAKPETFYSVTPTIDQVMVQPGAPYPLQVDVTFHILYNEAPEHAPTPEEVAEILEDAFATDEFVHFYLWGRDDIWNNVSSVKVEANFPEVGGGGGGGGVPDEPVGPSEPIVDVLGTMVYDFSVDPTTEPTEADFDQLTALTQTFFTDLLTDLFKDDPDTDFEQLVVTRQATTYDVAATPPAIIDFAFLVTFADASMIIPSSDALFDVMAANMFDSYIRLYLSPCECFWNTVDRVGFLESESPDAPTQPPGLIPPQSILSIQSSMIHSFFDGTESRPSKEDYDKLALATNVFFTETLTEYYQNVTETEMLMTSTEIESSFYSEETDQPLQVDYSTSVLFSGVGPTSDEVFAILEGGNYERYIMEFLWDEGEPWNNINGVMFLGRIPPPDPSS